MSNSGQLAISVKISIAYVGKLPADDQANWNGLKLTQECDYTVDKSRNELYI